MNIFGAIVCLIFAILAGMRMQSNKKFKFGYALSIVAFGFAATGFLFNEFVR